MNYLECVDCGNPKVENQETGQCGSCGAAARKAMRKEFKPKKEVIKLPPISSDRTRMNHKYDRSRTRFLKGKVCAAKFPHECNFHTNPTIQHMQGRVGFADEWARDNDIPLLIDERFFLPMCLNSHRYINDNPVFAWENQYAFKRVGDPIFRTSVNS